MKKIFLIFFLLFTQLFSTNLFVDGLPFSDERFITTQQVSTSLVWGGEVSVNAGDNTKFDVLAGAGLIVDAYTDPQNPNIQYVKWEDQIAIVPTYLNTNIATFISITAAGTVRQSTTSIVEEDMREYISLGVITHINLTNIDGADNYVVWAQDQQLLTFDFLYAMGSLINFTGNEFSANGANLKVDKSEGVMFGWGTDYKSNKKNPNFITTAVDTEVTLILAWRGTPTQAAFSTDVDVTQYDPNGDGSLVTIPDGFVTVHRLHYAPNTNSIVLQYGQFLYDSMKKAVNSWDKEDYVEIPENLGAPLRSAIAVIKGATDLSDREQCKFINTSNIGSVALSKIPSYSTYAEPIEILSGLSYERQAITFVEAGGVVYADVEEIGGGDMTYIFRQLEFYLNCTTGSGASGKARVALTAGSAVNPKKNWVYVTPSAGTTDAVLNSSTVEPTGEYAMVATIILPDVTTFSNYDSYGSRRWSDVKQVDGRGIISNIIRKLRRLKADYVSGLLPALILNPATSPDGVDFTLTAGVIREIYLQNTDSLQLSVDGAYVVNDQSTAYTRITNLNQITTTTLGTNLFVNNTYWQIIVAISTNVDGETKLLINKPTGKYANAADAFNDVDNYSLTTFPNDFETVSLVCAFVLRYQTAGGAITNAATGFGVNFIDLRGYPVGITASGSGSAAISEFSDHDIKIFNDVDATKILAFDVTGIATSTTRTLTLQDRNITIAAADAAGNIQIVDGVAAPDTLSGYGTIYIDTSDGDLKIKFGDGSIKTIVTDD